jgi:hypothetical protein
VTVPIGFVNPGTLDDAVATAQPPAAPPTSASPAALALASRIVSATMAARIRITEQQLRSQVTRQFAQLPLTEQEQAAIADYVEAAGAAIQSSTSAEAARYARVFTQQQLSDLANFFESPLGQAWINQTSDLAPEERAENNYLWAGVRTAARDKFCQQQGCWTPPAAPPR